MTYREKPAKEHPESISFTSWGGCNGCPKLYGYSNDSPDNCPFGGPSPKKCAKCWDREISNEPGECEPGKSYAEFTDGHKEEITFYERADAGGSILFATCSGVYLFITGIETLILDSLSPDLKFRHNQFYRVGYEPMINEPIMTAVENIRLIAIDTRIKHDYSVTLKDGRTATGSIWVERDASDKQIREAVLNDGVVEVMTKTTDA